MTATLTLYAGESRLRLALPEGQSVREALDETGVRVPAACGGTGACGACVVRVQGGAVCPPTAAECFKLTAQERAQGRRLACQLRLRGDAEVLLEHRAPPSVWKSLPAGELAAWAGPASPAPAHALGVAVDLGTTHLRVSLWDRRLGRRLAARWGPNPQAAYGADVLHRLAAAASSPQRAGDLAALARTAITGAVRDMLAREVGEVALQAEIGRVVVVGNTAMLILLAGAGAAALLDPDAWQRRLGCRPSDPQAWAAQWRLPHAELVLLPPLAGFLGSDLTADVIATGLLAGPAGSLLLDVGTNIEVALWDGRRLHATSVAGGPAFEAGGVRHGMPAGAGAVCGVRRLEGGAFECEVIGGGAAQGFCGSGLVAAVAALLGSGRLKPSGRFAAPEDRGGVALEPGNPLTAIAGSDVDALQRAKAAMTAAARVLLARAGLRWADLRRLCLCGAFGARLEFDHAQRLGLLPPIAPARVELHGNASLAGCERALLAADALGPGSAAGEALAAVNLATVPEYDELYVDHLPLRPLAAH